MSEAIHSPNIDRRQLLRAFIAVPAGAIVGAAASEASAAVEAGIDTYTGRRAGNPEEISFIEDRCGQYPEPTCVRELAAAPRQRFQSLVVGPLAEEAAFRALPSHILNVEETPPGQRIPSVVESSGDSWRLNRREAVVGMGAVIGNVALTTWPQSKPSIWPLPVANALNGVANWWLQRRGGYQAAVASNGMFSFLYGRRANARLYNVPTRS